MTDIQGYVIVHKETGERWGDCYASQTGAKTSWRHAMRDYWIAHSLEMKRFYKTGFNDQDIYVIKPLIIWEQ